MLQMQSFARDDVFPSWFANALTRALSVLSSQFLLVLTDTTHVAVQASANDGAAVISIRGQWRWIEATVTVAHPGGAAGTYPVFVTAANNNIGAAPQPYTDNTNYAFGLVIRPPGQTPALAAGVVDVYRHVGDAVWDGAKITRLDQLAPITPVHAGRHVAGGPDPLTPAMIGAIALGDPSSAQPGDFIVSGATSRAGCVLCDGAAYARTGAMAALFAALGTRYGAGDGSSTFNVPDYRDCVIIGASATRPLGSRGGENTHVLTLAESTPHAHAGVTDTAQATPVGKFVPLTSGAMVWTFVGSGGNVGVRNDGTTDWGGGVLPHSHPFSTNSQGGGGAHNNMQQFATANVFVKF